MPKPRRTPSRRLFRTPEPRRRVLEGALSWSFSPDSSEWALRTPSKAARSGSPHPRYPGCLTSSARLRIHLSDGVTRWMAESPRHQEQFEACLRDHRQALPPRMDRGRFQSPYRLVQGGRLIVTTQCSDRGELATTVHYRRNG
jgi:hypothetical protein